MNQESKSAALQPYTDIIETKEGVVLVADLPGVDEKDLDITLEKNVLSIRGRTSPDDFAEAFSPLYREYEAGNFERHFTVSSDIDRDHIKAELKNGVLRLTLPKAESQQPRKIAIRNAE